MVATTLCVPAPAKYMLIAISLKVGVIFRPQGVSWYNFYKKWIRFGKVVGGLKIG